MPPQQQHAAVGIAHDRARGLVGNPDDVMLEALAIGDLHVDEREPNPLAVVEISLAVHGPTHPSDCTLCARARFYGASVTRHPRVNRGAMSQAPTEASEPPAPEPPAPESPVASDRYARPAFIVFMVAELVALVFYMTISRPMWFYLDEWDFLANRTGGNLGDLFRAHNEHWVTIPGAGVPRDVVARRPATATGRTNSSSC